MQAVAKLKPKLKPVAKPKLLLKGQEWVLVIRVQLIANKHGVLKSLAAHQKAILANYESELSSGYYQILLISSKWVDDDVLVLHLDVYDDDINEDIDEREMIFQSLADYDDDGNHPINIGGIDYIIAGKVVSSHQG
jgi:hypothetical protein